MAAPCGRVASRCLHSVNYFGRTRISNTTLTLRRVSVCSVCRVSLKAKAKIESVASQWKLMGSVCLQRLPVISQDKTPIEEQFAQLMYQTELEKSLLSDHELRLLEDAERLRRKQSGDYDSDEEEEDRHGDDDIVLAQDLEDAWEQKLKQFLPTEPRTGDKSDQMSSLERCLADSLVLLVEQKVGDQKYWLLPQIGWEIGETLRQTAERALASSLPGAALHATFLGNTPCGIYKHKVPRGMHTENFAGAKIFFFKAILSDSASLSPSSETPPFVWVKKSELQDYLKPAYLEKVSRFVLNL